MQRIYGRSGAVLSLTTPACDSRGVWLCSDDRGIGSGAETEGDHNLVAFSLGPLFPSPSLFSFLFLSLSLSLLLLCGQYCHSFLHPSKTHQARGRRLVTGAGPPNFSIAFSPSAPSTIPSFDLLTPCATDYIAWRCPSHSP